MNKYDSRVSSGLYYNRLIHLVPSCVPPSNPISPHSGAWGSHCESTPSFFQLMDILGPPLTSTPVLLLFLSLNHIPGQLCQIGVARLPSLPGGPTSRVGLGPR
jgi:hypothetical protein